MNIVINLNLVQYELKFIIIVKFNKFENNLIDNSLFNKCR